MGILQMEYFVYWQFEMMLSLEENVGVDHQMFHTVSDWKKQQAQSNERNNYMVFD